MCLHVRVRSVESSNSRSQEAWWNNLLSILDAEQLRKEADSYLEKRRVCQLIFVLCTLYTIVEEEIRYLQIRPIFTD